jgi:hypothetical protein
LLIRTEALLCSAVLIVESVKIVPPEIIFWPLTVTCPETDNSPDALAPAPANATIE